MQAMTRQFVARCAVVVTTIAATVSIPAGAEELTITTLAGIPAISAGSFDGTGAAARFNNPCGVAADGSGNLFVADGFNHTIRRIVVATGGVTTLAGTAGSYGSADGIGAAARFHHPFAVAADGGGNLFVADTDNHTIRRIVVATGEVTTLAGTAGSSGSADGIGPAARLKNPDGVAADGSGNLIVADRENHTIRRIMVATREVTTLAGTAGSSGSADGIGPAARFKNPDGVAADGSGNLFVADRQNHTIRRIVVATGEVTTLAGTAGSSGSADGIGPVARFKHPGGVAADGSGNLLVADTASHTIRRIVVATGEVTTLAGTAGSSGSADGMGPAARFRAPSSVAADGSGNLFVADLFNHTIRRIVVATGEVTTLAGTAGSSGSADGIGPVARFNSPCGVAADGSGNLFVADNDNHTIRRIVVATGEVTTLAGTAGSSGSADGIGPAARFKNPGGVAADGSGNLFVADIASHTIRRIVVATGEVTTLAGTAGSHGSVDGTGAAARFFSPNGVAADGSGNVFVADTYNHTIRRIAVATGEVTTLAGRAGWDGSADGIGAAARFCYHDGVAADNSGNVLVADTENCTIRRIVVATGEVTTLAGTAGSYGSVDGTGAAARFFSPNDVATDGMGNVFVADLAACTIRLGSPTLDDAATIDQPSGLIGQVRQLDTAPQNATSWMWEVVRRPSGGTAQLSDSTVRNPTIIPDRTDLWEFRLTAEGPGGKSISLVTLLAQPDAEPRVRRRLARLP